MTNKTKTFESFLTSLLLLLWFSSIFWITYLWDVKWLRWQLTSRVSAIRLCQFIL